MWEVYDALLDRVSAEDRIRYVRCGESWLMVKTEKGLLGVAAVQRGRSGKTVDGSRFAGMPLAEAAELVKSWDFEQAALGLAAINACLNQERFFPVCGEPDAFLRYRDRAAGKKVAVIGRFSYLEERLRNICELSVLERQPNAGEYPDAACEYLLPEMDLVFITGCTVSNKTLPRLLELSQHAFTVVTGPSTPMSDLLFDFSADALCGFCVTNEEDCVLATEGKQGLFQCGRMVCREKE